MGVPVSKAGAGQSKFICVWLLSGFENYSGPVRRASGHGSRHEHTYTPAILKVLSSYEYQGNSFSSTSHPGGQADTEQILCT